MDPLNKTKKEPSSLVGKSLEFYFAYVLKIQNWKEKARDSKAEIVTAAGLD